MAVGAVRQYTASAAGVVVVGVESRQRPNQPLLVHVVVVASVDEVVVVVAVSSLQPNQPGCAWSMTSEDQ